MLRDDQWPIARLIQLISTSGIEAQDRSASSAFLAVLTAVEELSEAPQAPGGASERPVALRRDPGMMSEALR